jgi:carboxylesterase type B
VGSEDCLNLNIWTSYLPADGGRALKKDLKPVMVSIFGGGFQTGHPNIPANDGGGLACRGDVVVVAINYRLGSFGLLPLNNGANNGNYGISDQVLALDWIRANIADFGGDPDRITLFGESAGGASVRVHVASPKSGGKFVGAIAQSFGLAGTIYAPFLTINDGILKFTAPTLAAFNCTDATSQVDCLRAVPTDKLTSFATQADNLVVDGVYVTAPLLPTTLPKGVHFMSGTMRDDGAAFLPAYPTTENLTEWLEAGNVSFVGASGLFPLPPSNNATLAIFNVTNRMLTDYTFLCPSQTVLKQFANSSDAGIYGYVFNRAYQPASWNPWNGLCRPPATTAHPNGDPSQEYFKCHAGEMYYTFGNLAREGQHFRDDADLPFMQYIVDAWTSFGRTYDPNPDPALLKARRYDNTAKELARSGKWLPIEGDYTMRALDWPTSQVGVAEAAQCAVVGWPGL